MSKKQKKLPPQDPSDKLFDVMFEFKITAKQMEKESKKADTQSKNLIKKVKDCIAKNDYEQAKVLASDAIRQKNMVKRYRNLSFKINTIASRLKSAYQNQQITEAMTNLTNKLLSSGNLNVVKMVETMDNFEKVFDNLEVDDQMMNQVLDNVNAGTVNDAEVNQLITQVAQQNGLKLSDDFDSIKIEGDKNILPEQKQAIGEDGFPIL